MEKESSTGTQGNTLENIPNPNATAAVHEATTGAEYANEGRKRREVFYSQAQTIGKWNALLNNDPVTLFTLIFIVCFGADILVAWEMYRDVVAYVLPDTPVWAMLLLGVLINGFAAVVAHYFSKTKSMGLFNYEVYNLQHLTHRGEKPYELAVREVDKDKKSDFIWFLVGFVLLLAITAFIAFNRTFLLQAAGSPEADYNWLQKVLPVVIVIAEVFTGIYLVFVIKRWVWQIKAFFNNRKFKTLLRLTNEHDKIAGRLIQTAKENGEHIDYQRNLKSALYRLQFRDLDDKYIDEVVFNQAEFMVKSADDVPVTNVPIVGITGGGAMTNATFTDDFGKATVHWQTQTDTLVGIKVNGIEIPGPFGKNVLHVVRLMLTSPTRPPGLLNR